MDNKKYVQVKFNQYLHKYQEKSLSLPELKFLKQIAFGILRSGHIHISKIGSSLEEDITLKNTCKRLGYHLGKEDLYDRINESHIAANRHFLSRCPYLVIDGSDITKLYARKMEGLGKVHDGSTGEIATGYWQMNLIGVNPSTSSTVLASSRLYSFETQIESPDISENGVILEEIERIDSFITHKQIVVIDRGGDRRVLIERFLTNSHPFIIRQTGRRHIIHEGRQKRLNTVGKKTDLKWEVTLPKLNSKKRVIHKFKCGAVRVKFPHQHQDCSWEQPLWLVTTQQEGKGRCYFLSYIDAETENEAIKQVMEGYGCRWRIEEVHRQVKQDYNYEDVCLRRYTALRNFNALFWTTMGFLYQQLEDISLKLIMQFREPLIYTGKLHDLGEFYLYKLSRVVKDLFLFTNIRPHPNIGKHASAQMELCI